MLTMSFWPTSWAKVGGALGAGVMTGSSVGGMDGASVGPAVAPGVSSAVDAGAIDAGVSLLQLTQAIATRSARKSLFMALRDAPAHSFVSRITFRVYLPWDGRTISALLTGDGRRAMENAPMAAWGVLLGIVFVLLIVLRAVAARRLRAGDSGMIPFLLGPTVLLLVLPIVAIIPALPKLGLVGIVILAFLGLNAFLLLRPVLWAARITRAGGTEKVLDVMATELGEAMLGSMALMLIVAIAGGLAFVFVAILTR
jgi:hypothetical protein